MATPIDMLLDKVEWKTLRRFKPKENIPYATHEGILEIGDIQIRVYQLNTGQRVIEEGDLVALLKSWGKS